MRARRTFTLRSLAIVALLATTATTLPAQGSAPAAARPVDWTALQRDGVALMRDYLRINTTNPPGNELAAARFIRDFLAKEGIEAQILDTAELGAGRANLYARVKGNGTKKAVALVHHMDVVPVVGGATGRCPPSRARCGTASSMGAARST